MTAVTERKGMTPEQQAVHDAWVASLSGRQTPKYEAAQKIGKTPKPVNEGHMAQVLASGQKYRAVA